MITEENQIPDNAVVTFAWNGQKLEGVLFDVSSDRKDCRPAIDPKTAAALIEMMQCAAKQLYGYEGPTEVEILPDREPFLKTYETPSQEDFFYAQHTF